MGGEEGMVVSVFKFFVGIVYCGFVLIFFYFDFVLVVFFCEEIFYF